MPKDEFDPEDPNELVGVALPAGDADEIHMTTCVVEEFLRMGMPRAQLLEKFENPFYRMTHGIYLRRGRAWVEGLIDTVVEDWRARTCRT